MTLLDPVFVLLTDFGQDDPYAGQMKAALFSRAPHIPILDLTHGVPPFAVATGAFFLVTSYRHYPPGAVFICVVDPGVGSSRDLLAIRNNEYTLLGPDNGLLSMAYADMLHRDGAEVFSLATSEPPASTTFHGRDIFAPTAAAIATGTAPPPLFLPFGREPERPTWVTARIEPDAITVTVLHVDRFGNCILNLPTGSVPENSGSLQLDTPEGNSLYPLVFSACYADLTRGAVGLVAGSQGFYELACNSAPAAERLGLCPGAIRVIRNAV